jgi:hypothetical protein
MKRNFGLSIAVGLMIATLAIGGVLLTSPTAEAVTPPLLCGPTILWVCSGPGGPDVLFGGTVCEKEAYEKETGRTCVPY